ncbi:tetratricopeptide repeat protein, partial [Lacticaseibacillus rhamnosus]
MRSRHSRDGAEPLYQRAVGIWEKVKGPEDPRSAFGLNNLGALYSAQGRYAEAEALFKRALAIIVSQQDEIIGTHQDSLVGFRNDTHLKERDAFARISAELLRNFIRIERN